MSKPEDIPQDVWGDAEYHVTGPRPTRDDEWETVEMLARAIMAAKAEEREACARVAEYSAERGAFAMGDWVAVSGEMARCGPKVAAAIRERGNKEK